METTPAALITEHPEWQLILQAYLAAEGEASEQVAAERAEAKRQAKAAAKAAPVPAPVANENSFAAEESNGDDSSGEDDQRKQIWVRRLREVDGVPVDCLAPIHGRLIAEGLLQFTLGGREEGVLYRLTRDAKQALASLPAITAEAIPEAGAEADAPAEQPSKAA